MRTMTIKIPFLFRLFNHLLLLVMVAGLLSSCASKRTIVNGLDEKEANEILVFLAGKGINATKVQAATEGGGGGRAVLWNISVQETQANEAMALLNQVGLPRRRSQNLLDIFSNVGLVPSGMEQKIRYQAGLGEQIASTIRKIDGVLDAEVNLTFPEEDPLNPTAVKQPLTASVYVKHNGILDDPNAHLVTRMKRLVAGSVPGLDYDNVTVIGDRARFNEPAFGGAGGGEDEKNYVNVWSIIVAKESLTRFRTIFFTFTISLLLLTLGVLWMLWKFFPILRLAGGFKKLFSFHPINVEDIVGEGSVLIRKDEAEAAKAAAEAGKEEDTTAGKGIDET